MSRKLIFVKLAMPLIMFVIFATAGLFILADNPEPVEQEDARPEYFGGAPATPAAPMPAMPSCGRTKDGAGSCLDAVMLHRSDFEIVHFISFYTWDGLPLCTVMFVSGEDAIYTAPEKEGYVFEGWELPDGQVAATFIASEDKSVTAVYAALD